VRGWLVDAELVCCKGLMEGCLTESFKPPPLPLPLLGPAFGRECGSALLILYHEGTRRHACAGSRRGASCSGFATLLNAIYWFFDEDIMLLNGTYLFEHCCL